MKVLGFDTAMAACSAAIWCDGNIAAYRLVPQPRGHAETIMPMIADICLEAGIAVSELDRIGVTIGPGTFTGQRVGLAAARAMVLGTKVGIVGVTTLRALAAGVQPDSAPLIASLIDARRGEVYAQVFDRQLSPVMPPQVLTPERAARALTACAEGGNDLVLVGTGALLVADVMEPRGFTVTKSQASPQPDARHVAALAAAADTPDGIVPSPLYLRPPDAKLPGRKQD
ncbi:MAG: tRNA (adenosine(37)-N6)-threonylcarbamoyltransferase complex dimerization subunit type 1 TsaB [Alphaproteobacteria bacterium]|nr:MAG: tRNA (adenosine(37)-N6)-threonylcarbamoyltransferase complex dimerization subunit type 1 TsaB [Alphaproteobacteria bacterium]